MEYSLQHQRRTQREGAVEIVGNCDFSKSFWNKLDVGHLVKTLQIKTYIF